MEQTLSAALKTDMLVCVLQKYSFVCPVENHLPSVPENVRSIIMHTQLSK